MARPIEFCKQQALENAMELFWSKGYEATSLTDLLKVMQISKSSFYQSFGSKCELFKKTLLLHNKNQEKQLHQKLNKDGKIRENFKTMLNNVSTNVNSKEKQRGCFISNVAIEFAQTDGEIAKIVRIGFENFEDEIFKAIKIGQDNGTIATTLSSHELAKLFVTVYSGLKTMVKSGSSKKELDVSIAALFKLF